MSVVFPAYNENARIRKAMFETADYLKGKKGNYEIIVIENGSSDNTYELAIQTALDIVREPTHNIAIRVDQSDPGKGSALRKGMELSKGTHVLLTDVDLSTPLREMYRLLSYQQNGADISIASRKLGASVVVGRSNDRKFIGSVFNGLTSLLVPGIRDTQCGFKLLSRNAVEMICPLLTIDGFAFDVELLFIARRLGYFIAEVPVYWKHDDNSTVRVVPDSLKMARDIVKIGYNYATGAYKV